MSAVVRREAHFMSAAPDSSRVTTELNDLVRRLALLAAPRDYSLTARLLGGGDGSRVELRAARNAGAEIREYIRHVTLTLLERHGATAIAKDFAREAAEALADSDVAAHLPGNRRSVHKR
jgi:hypothetical protein